MDEVYKEVSRNEKRNTVCRIYHDGTKYVTRHESLDPARGANPVKHKYSGKSEKAERTYGRDLKKQQKEIIAQRAAAK